MSVYVYGAGRMAQAAFHRLLRAERNVEGFIVTGKEGNPETLFGRPVVPLEAFASRPGSAIVVATGIHLHAEISALLKARGLPHFLYCNATLRPAP